MIILFHRSQYLLIIDHFNQTIAIAFFYLLFFVSIYRSEKIERKFAGYIDIAI